MSLKLSPDFPQSHREVTLNIMINDVEDAEDYVDESWDHHK
jgi:hypothetical protein